MLFNLHFIDLCILNYSTIIIHWKITTHYLCGWVRTWRLVYGGRKAVIIRERRECEYLRLLCVYTEWETVFLKMEWEYKGILPYHFTLISVTESFLFFSSPLSHLCRTVSITARCFLFMSQRIVFNQDGPLWQWASQVPDLGHSRAGEGERQIFYTFCAPSSQHCVSKVNVKYRMLSALEHFEAGFV